MNNFDFHSPASVADAIKAIGAGDDGRFLAGGQSLLPAMKTGLSMPTDLVGLDKIAQIKGICTSAPGAGKPALHIGAMTTHASVAANADVIRLIPALAMLADNIGDSAVRARGTIGGSLGLNDPAACYPASVLGLGASIRTDRRSIAADDFFKGLYTTALDAGELITAVEFPIPEKAAWVKFKQPASRFSLVGVFVSKSAAGVRVAVTGAGSCAFRVPALEAALSKNWSASACDGISVSAEGLNADLHASAAYRAHLIGVLCKRAVAAAG
jgi:carbon-monoxide dehydrogenase medium subunit